MTIMFLKYLKQITCHADLTPCLFHVRKSRRAQYCDKTKWLLILALKRGLLAQLSLVVPADCLKRIQCQLLLHLVKQSDAILAKVDQLSCQYKLYARLSLNVT